MPLAVYCARPSHTARAFATTLGVRKLGDDDPGTHIRRMRRLRGPRWTVINYGTSYVPWWDVGAKWINHPDSVKAALSKLATSAALAAKEVPQVRITTDRAVADGWVQRGHRVLTRRDGLSQGKGIREGVLDLGPSMFYSRVYPKTHEFRVHVGRGQVLDFVEKKAPLAEVEVNRLIRTHENGWVFAHANLTCNEEDKTKMQNLAIMAIEALGLDFGAVDLLAIFDKREPRRLRSAVVCEVNTAPGIQGLTSFDKYLSFFNSLR